MKLLGRFARALKGRIFKKPVEREVRDEVDFHLEMLEREFRALGWSEAEARRRARDQFGDVAGIERRMRELGDQRDRVERRTEYLADLTQDVRYALRQLVRAPGFAAAAIVTLALGIGACASIFSVVNAVLLRPFPFAEPERIVRLFETNPQGDQWGVSEPNYLDFQARSRSFAALAAYGWRPVNLIGEGDPERLDGLRITHEFDEALGVAPILGRAFAEGDGRAGGPAIVMISERLFRRRFASDTSLVTLGRAINLDGTPYQVVGVMTSDLDTFREIDVWLPFVPSMGSSRDNHIVTLVGRLPPGVTLAQATTDVEGIARRLGEQYPQSNARWGVNLVGIREWLIGSDVTRRVVVLLAAVGLLLLMGCVNVANLMLARAGTRQREMSVRAALGAGRGRLVRQLLIEGLTLAGAGAALGMALTLAAVPVLRDMGGDAVPRLTEMAVDWRVVAFAVAASIATGLLFGSAPALLMSRVDVADALHGGMRIVASGRLRSALIVMSVGLAVLLLAGAGLIGGSFARLMRVDTGLEPEGVLTASLALRGERYQDAERRRQFVAELLQRLEATPGVRAAGITNITPYSGGNTAIAFVPTDRAAAAPDEYMQAGWRTVTPGYFPATGIRLVRGRLLDASDVASGAPVIVISEAMARLGWPDGDAVGKGVRDPGSGSQMVLQVVGVVADTRDLALEQEPAARFYYAFYQFPSREVSLLVRTDGDPMAILPAVQREVWAIDPNLPVAQPRPLAEMLSDVAAQPRLTTLIFVLTAGAALALALVGVYGLIAYTVTQRTREIGVRLALGARPRQIVAGVVRRGLVMAGAGVVIGLVAAGLLAGYARVLLYGVEPVDAATYALVAGLLLLCATLASLIPARRAARLSPTRALAAD